MKEGIYQTTYGNAAYVSPHNLIDAYDLDSGEVIPIEMVTSTFLREADDSDRYQAEDNGMEGVNCEWP